MVFAGPWLLPLLAACGGVEPYVPQLPNPWDFQGPPATTTSPGTGTPDTGDTGPTDTGTTPTYTGSFGCSQPNGPATTITVENLSADQTYAFAWSDWYCVEWSVGEITPLETRVENTFVGHVWTVRDQYGALIGWWETTPDLVVQVP